MILVEAESPVLPVATIVYTPALVFLGMVTRIEQEPLRFENVFPRKTVGLPSVKVIFSLGAKFEGEHGDCAGHDDPVPHRTTPNVPPNVTGQVSLGRKLWPPVPAVKDAGPAGRADRFTASRSGRLASGAWRDPGSMAPSCCSRSGPTRWEESQPPGRVRDWPKAAVAPPSATSTQQPLIRAGQHGQ